MLWAKVMAPFGDIKAVTVYAREAEHPRNQRLLHEADGYSVVRISAFRKSADLLCGPVSETLGNEAGPAGTAQYQKINFWSHKVNRNKKGLCTGGFSPTVQEPFLYEL